jgi:hypothetical protein
MRHALTKTMLAVVTTSIAALGCADFTSPERDTTVPQRIAMEVVAASADSGADTCTAPKPPPTTVTVTTVTTGADLDPDGYAIRLAGADGEETKTFRPNETLTFTSLSAPQYTATLAGAAENCTVDGGNTRTVNIPANGAGQAEFNITCAGPETGNITVTTTTTGMDLDPNGYTVALAGPSGTSRAFGTNESFTFRNLTPGSYTVAPTGAANNCVITSNLSQQTVTVSVGSTGQVAYNIECGTIVSGRVTGLGALGTGPQTPGTNRMDFDFDAASAPGGRMVLTDYFIINPDGGAARMTADAATDPATGITSFSRISANCLRFGGTGRLRTGDTQRFIIDACDSASPGAGLDRLVINFPDESQILRQGAISEGDIAISTP